MTLIDVVGVTLRIFQPKVVLRRKWLGFNVAVATQVFTGNAN